MSEYIITEQQLKTATEAFSEREVPLPITSVFISGDKLPEIVRCGDCVHFATNIHGSYCKKSISTTSDSDGFCAWGERRNA